MEKALILKIIKIFMILFLVLHSQKFFAQPITNVDEKFNKARELAFNGNRLEAIEICDSALKYYPNNDEIRIFKSRILAWEKRFGEARDNLILVKNQDMESAIELKMDIALWSGDYLNLYNIVDQALNQAPTNENYLYNKALAQKNLNDLKGAGQTLNQLLNLNPSHEKALSMKDLIELAGIINSVSVNYNLSLFNRNFDPWHLAFLEFSRKFGFGSLIFRINYASRFKTNGYQLESDGYISFWDGIYSYLNIGYSPTKLFPDFRFGIEPYFKLPYSMEISLGYRYLMFGDKSVNLYSGHLGKYMGNYWISIRPFITPKRNSTNLSGIIILRRYFSDADNSISLQLGLGLDPSIEPNDTEFLKFDSKKIGIEYQTTLSHYLILKSSFNYGEEEYFKDRWRKVYEIKLGLKRRF